MMDNQHRKISGYRELTQDHIDLMNEIKKKGAELVSLSEKVEQFIDEEYEQMLDDINSEDEENLILHLEKAQPYMWLEEGIKAVQKGVMFLVRSVAQPTDGS